MVQFAPSTRAGNKPFRSEDHNHHQDDAKEQVSYVAEGETGNEMGDSVMQRVQRIGRVGSQSIELRQKQNVDRVDGERTNDHSRYAADAANDHHREVDHGVAEAKVIRRNTAKLCRIISARNP